MGKARIVSGGANGSYTIEVKYDTTRIDARLADIEATLPVIQDELDALDTQLETSRAELTAAVAAMNAQINLINATKPFDGAYIDGLIDDMQFATGAIEDKNIEIDDAYQTLTGYEAAIDAAVKNETDMRADYQRAQADLSAYVAETGDTSSGLYLSMVAGVEIKLAAYQDAQQVTINTKAVFEPQIATQKAEIAQLKEDLKILQDQYKSVNAEFVAVTQAMEAWSKQDQGAIDAAGKVAIQANAKYVLTRFKRDEKKREVAELTQEQKWLNKAKGQTAETRQAWCADLTTTLAANLEVGTIEIAQEWKKEPPIIIRPAYANAAVYDRTRDGGLSKLPNMSPHSAWFNMALYPAMAKWKPQYRRGTLTAVSGNFGAVDLEATYSSATKTVGGVSRLAVNQSSTLSNVPIVYMTCNGAAFAVGDRVVVEFVGRNWNQPRIVGFVENPKPCPTSPPGPTPPPGAPGGLGIPYYPYQLMTRQVPATVGPNIGDYQIIYYKIVCVSSGWNPTDVGPNLRTMLMPSTTSEIVGGNMIYTTNFIEWDVNYYDPLFPVSMFPSTQYSYGLLSDWVAYDGTHDVTPPPYTFYDPADVLGDSGEVFAERVTRIGAFSQYSTTVEFDNRVPFSGLPSSIAWASYDYQLSDVGWVNSCYWKFDNNAVRPIFAALYH